MRITVWALSTCIPDEAIPCYPEVFATEEEALAVFKERMREEWEAGNGAYDDETCEQEPFPDDPFEAHRIMAELDDEMRWGRYELSSHVIEVKQEEAVS